ncbi:proteinase-activated receptor 3-like [Latimeria chalumnae]|uniref:proteinase-activated receptor 3-like n=1 Tax=Latimeria chalumnae TaxID=7897 RepID=UPI00313BC86A
MRDICQSTLFKKEVDNGTGAQTTNIPHGNPESVQSPTGFNVSESAVFFLTSSITTMLLPMIYTIVLLLGLPLNGFALWILCTRIKKVTSTIFLINLAAANFLFTCMLPFKISYYFLGNDWRLGEYTCRIASVAFYGNMYCSMLLLTCFSVNRYIGIVYPFKYRTLRRKRFPDITCLVVWILVSLLMVPFLYNRQSYLINGLNITTCHDVLPVETKITKAVSNYFVCLVVFAFILPFSVIVFCFVCVLKALLPHKQRSSLGSVLSTRESTAACF